MYKLSLCILLVAVFSSIEAHSAGSRRLLQENESVWEDAKDGINSAFGSFFGGQCVSEAQCTDYIATCSSSSGECRPVWWMWLILASIVLSLLVSCICCICCCIKDVICCCCH